MRSLCSSQWRGIPSGSADEIFRRAAGSGRGSAVPCAGAGRGGRRAGPRGRLAARRGAVRRPQPQRAAGLGRAAEFRNLPGRGGQAGTWQQSGEEGLGGQGRGGRRASISLMGLLAVGMNTFLGGRRRLRQRPGFAGVSVRFKGWR